MSTRSSASMKIWKHNHVSLLLMMRKTASSWKSSAMIILVSVNTDVIKARLGKKISDKVQHSASSLRLSFDEQVSHNVFQQNATHWIFPYFYRHSVCVCVCVCVYVCMCVSVCVCVNALLVEQWKTTWDKSTTFHHIVVHKKPFNDVFDNVVAHNLDLLFEGQRFELRLFW